MTRLAVIGLGLRATVMLVELSKADPALELAAVADPNMEQVVERFAWPGFPPGPDLQVYPDADALLAHADQFDGVLIGTPCMLHTPVAVKVAATGLPLFMEKPVAVTEEQVSELAAAFAGRLDSVVVSFPLRATPLFTAVLDIVRSGRLGEINQVQAYNYVPYGGVYFAQWYRDFELTHGMWLQKATHDFDYINLLVGSQPTRIAATATQKIYGGTMPHDLRCSACDRVDHCVESPQNIALRGDDGGMGFGDHLCVFSREIKNHDAGSALIEYADGSHASYAQNFVSRRGAARRGAIVTGYEATLEFDWYTDSIKVVDHHTNRTEDVTVKADIAGHMGGDAVLSRMFLDVVGGAKSNSTLGDGLRSVSMCLAATRSAESGQFEVVRTAL
jgi:predicted dehydrogenase